jgi:type IV pilus assembly protein PilA
MFKLVNKLKNRKGFTLIELIVVLAVLAIIMAIAVPRFLGVQEQAKIDADYATGAMIAKAAELYAVTNDDTSISLSDLTTDGKYMDETTAFQYYINSSSAADVQITIDDYTATVKACSATAGTYDVTLYPDGR